jgi:hypothetical protein
MQSLITFHGFRQPGNFLNCFDLTYCETTIGHQTNERLSGKVAKALMEKAPELLAEPPKIEKADVLADRLLG